MTQSASFESAHPGLRRALASRGYETPTPVQAAVMGAGPGDLLVSAQTGSGKTVAFGLALAGPLLGEQERFTAAGAPRALVVTPTRELALQVHRELTWLYAETGARIATCVGGMDPRRESNALSHGVHIVVGTPGRLCDHLARGALVLSKIEALVLDEADEMLDMGFREDLEKLLEGAPAARRTLLFSATIPREIAALAKKYQRDAQRIATSAEGERHRDIEYLAVPVVPRERIHAVVNLLRFHDASGALVFCATRDGVANLAANLSERGFSVVALSGELSQRERNTALQALRDGRARVCVATDVAARGLDLPDLGLVIHGDLPQNAQVLVHRSGRTGRAGKHGVAILIVPEPARRYAERLVAQAHLRTTWQPPPSADDIRNKDQEQLAREIRELSDQPSDDDRAVARALLADRPAEDLVAALVRMRRDARPAPEDITPPQAARERPSRARAGEPPPPRARSGEAPREARHPAHDDHERPRAHASAHAPAHAHAAAHSPRAAARPPARRPGRGDDAAPTGVWFTVNVGRYKNADPKWLVPLLCRRGDVTKRAIGKIEILARETRVEIAPDAAVAFARAVARPDPKDPNIHIERLDI